MKTTATTGKPRRVKAPVKKSESHIGRMRHSCQARPPHPVVAVATYTPDGSSSRTRTQ